MNDFNNLLSPPPAPSEADNPKVYISSREDASFRSQLLVKEGLIAKGVGFFQFQVAKISQETINNYKLAKKLLHPHEQSGFKEPDVEANLSLIQKQNLFVSLFVERLNDPKAEVPALPNTRFIMNIDSLSYTRLDYSVDSADLEAAKKACGNDISKKGACTIVLRTNDGTGNYVNFLELSFLDKHKDEFTAAFTDAVYLFEKTLQLMAAQASRPVGNIGPTPDGTGLGSSGK